MDLLADIADFDFVDSLSLAVLDERNSMAMVLVFAWLSRCVLFFIAYIPLILHGLYTKERDGVTLPLDYLSRKRGIFMLDYLIREMAKITSKNKPAKTLKNRLASQTANKINKNRRDPSG